MTDQPNHIKLNHWRIVYSRINDELYIYRDDQPGEMILATTDDGYQFQAYADSETKIGELSPSFTALTSQHDA